MIVYGTRNKQLATEHLTEKCTHCGTQNSVEMHVFQKYAHIFWIPFFPMRKTGISQCNHCKQVLQLKEMPPSLKASYETVKAQTKTPLWTFAGAGLFAVLIVIGIISAKEKDERNAKFIASPRSGDIFEIKTSNNQYTLYKVTLVQGDSVFVAPSNYETNKKTGLADLKKKEFSAELMGFSLGDLKRMLEEDEIVDVDR